MPTPLHIKPHHFVDIVTSCADAHVGSSTRGSRRPGTPLRCGGEESSVKKVPLFDPHPYGHALHTVAELLLRERETVLVLVLGADDICGPCMHNVEGGCVDTIDTSYRPGAPESKGAWNLTIDLRWCERLEVTEGDRFTARAFCERIRDRMGDITDIYREIPAHMTADRAARLNAGVERYLSE